MINPALSNEDDQPSSPFEFSPNMLRKLNNNNNNEDSQNDTHKNSRDSRGGSGDSIFTFAIKYDRKQSSVNV